MHYYKLKFKDGTDLNKVFEIYNGKSSWQEYNIYFNAKTIKSNDMLRTNSKKEFMENHVSLYNTSFECLQLPL